jgi:hypothetical protein
MALSEFQFQRFLKKNGIKESRVKGYVPSQEPKKPKKKIEKKKKTGVNDKKLWSIFSIFIRLRDADKNGICKCFTCNKRRPWKEMHCGHGLGRQFWGTKYSEINNHAQCVQCNSFEEGKKEIYKQKVLEKYGPKAWDKLELAKAAGRTLSQFEVDQLTIHYQKEVEKLKKIKKA